MTLIGLTFEEQGHVYKYDGTHVPSVTQAMRLTGLGTDYSAVPKLLLQQASLEGQLVHAILAGLLHEPPESWDRFAKSFRHPQRKVEGCVRAACAWLELMWKNLRVEMVERPLYSALHGVAGTLDFVGLLFGRRTLFEWKTTLEKNEKTAGIQTAGYQLLYEENEKLEIDQRMMLHLRPRIAYWDGWATIPLTNEGDLGTFMWALREAYKVEPEKWTLYGAQQGEI